MSGYTDKAVQALLRRAQLGAFVPQVGDKIADITHADTNEHTLTQADLGIPAIVVALLGFFTRVSGTSTFVIRGEAAGTSMNVQPIRQAVWPLDDTGVFRYYLGAANDDWDVHCFGYWVQGVVIE